MHKLYVILWERNCICTFIRCYGRLTILNGGNLINGNGDHFPPYIATWNFRTVFRRTVIHLSPIKLIDVLAIIRWVWFLGAGKIVKPVEPARICDMRYLRIFNRCYFTVGMDFVDLGWPWLFMINKNMISGCLWIYFNLTYRKLHTAEFDPINRKFRSSHFSIYIYSD